MDYIKMNRWLLDQCYSSNGVTVCLLDGAKMFCTKSVFVIIPNQEIKVAYFNYCAGSPGLADSLFDGNTYAKEATFHGDYIVRKVGCKKLTLAKLYNGSAHRYVDEKLLKMFEDRSQLQVYRFADEIDKYPIIYILEDNSIIGGILPVKYNEG